MRENRQSGSEGREARKRAFLTPIREAIIGRAVILDRCVVAFGG